MSDFIKGKSYHIHMPEVDEVRKIHIVEIVENDMIVYKFFGKHKRWWHYKIDHLITLRSRYELAKKLKK